MIEPMNVPRGSHRRYNPLRDEWVLVSPGRVKRPWDGAVEPADPINAVPYDPACYLCPGNERANGARNPQYSSTFIFTNDFAALEPGPPDESRPADELRPADESFNGGLLRAQAAPGTCRVMCFSPRHNTSLGGMPAQQVRDVIDLWAAQTTELGATYPWVQVFENRGTAMGASNPHPHGQIWASAALPSEGAREQATQRNHFAATGRPLLLDYALAEADGPRAVIETDGWLIVVPFWAVWPFETLLLPRQPAARLADLDGPARADLADALGRLLRRYDTLFDTPFPYSMGWHQAPFDGTSTESWQLHAHYYPPLLRSATVRKFLVGYELLSEPQRDLTAEEAAQRLKG